MNPFPAQLAIVDVETTGGSAVADRVIEVAVIRVENMKIVEKFSSLVDPGVRIPPFITGITGISDSDVSGAPAFGEVAKTIEPLLKGAVFTAHNARFDYGFMKNEFGKLEKSFRADLLCTVQFLRRLNPEWGKYNLDEVIRRFNLVCDARHRALGDCEVLWQMFEHVNLQYKYEVLVPAISQTLKYPTLPKHISEDQLSNLPEGAGVYLFYDIDETLLYIGKSVNLKDRIRSHFSSDYTNSKDQKIREQVARIETIETAGELGALLLESRLVKEKQPLLNRFLRLARKMLVALSYETEDGYMGVKLENWDGSVENIETDKIVGIFRSKKQAVEYLRKLSSEFELCHKFLNIEKTKRECFGYQLGTCKGACGGKEKSITYNMRFVSAFSDGRLKQWPFGSAVVYEEGNGDKTCTHLIDQWCYLGELNEHGEILERKFDYDVYKILVGKLLSEKSTKLKKVRISDIIG